MTDLSATFAGAVNPTPAISVYFRPAETVVRVWAISSLDGFRVDSGRVQVLSPALDTAELGAAALELLHLSAGLAVPVAFADSQSRPPTHLSDAVGLSDDVAAFGADNRMVSVAWNARRSLLFVNGSVNLHTRDLSFDYLTGVTLTNPTVLDLGLAIDGQRQLSS